MDSKLPYENCNLSSSSKEIAYETWRSGEAPKENPYEMTEHIDAETKESKVEETKILKDTSISTMATKSVNEGYDFASNGQDDTYENVKLEEAPTGRDAPAENLYEMAYVGAKNSQRIATLEARRETSAPVPNEQSSEGRSKRRPKLKWIAVVAATVVLIGIVAFLAAMFATQSSDQLATNNKISFVSQRGAETEKVLANLENAVAKMERLMSENEAERKNDISRLQNGMERIGNQTSQRGAETENSLANLENVVAKMERLMRENEAETKNVISKLENGMERIGNQTSSREAETKTILTNLERSIERMDNETRKEREEILKRVTDLEEFNGVWYRANNGLLYNRSSISSNFEEAKRRCEVLRGRLASTGMRNKSVVSDLQRANILTTTGAWVGLYELTGVNDWTWTDRAQYVAGSTLWKSGQPNNDGDCGIAYIPGSEDGFLWDRSCSKVYPFLCEK